MVDKAAKIGWIGTGIMGKNMAGYLQKAGYGHLSVFNRTASKADDLVRNGATFMPAIEVAKQADYLFLMLGYPHDVESMVIGDVGVLSHMKRGAFLIDHTSSSPELAVRIHEKAKVAGVESVDAPVTGGDIGARNGTLVVMTGGDKEAAAHVTPLLENYAQDVRYMGVAGAGHHTKMAN